MRYKAERPLGQSVGAADLCDVRPLRRYMYNMFYPERQNGFEPG